jgi:hypothetical protein
MSLNPFPFKIAARKAIGVIWLSSVTFFYGLFYLYFSKLPIIQSISLGIGIIVITGIILHRSVNTLRQANKRLLYDKSEERIRRRHYVRKSILILLILEILGLSIATVTLIKYNYNQYIVPYDLVIIACQFFPLSRIFILPVFYSLGIIQSLIGILIMFFVPISLQIGDQVALIAIPSLSFILLNWIIILFSLRDGMKHLSSTYMV